MPQRRAIPGLKTRSPLRDDAEYRQALKELHLLGQAALGTPRTRGLQDLVDCILDYEIARGLSGEGERLATGISIEAGMPDARSRGERGGHA
jgi:hypothetical protein